ncbi:membrane protein [Pustulibacterium marinum]|uniref:Membrane protein n=1 Tax=Pustulibacterium marinum TaxID=1224947 RepID=A0A1I7FT61_9FLAO|nr:YihY/virulence factor BrkB family protein [Pustulibacterium marinum]SFU39414.1 membrane protein [Pustulibacterium marinum]
MSAEVEARLQKIPVVKNLVKLLKGVKLKALEGLSLYDVLEMYTYGIVKGALTYRAAAISYSFFIAIFPFLLFLMNLIPYVPIEDFQHNFLAFVESLLPPKTASWFDPVLEDIANRKRGGLLSSVFLLSIFLMANGINSIFGGFENSYHKKIKRNYFRQYAVSVAVALMLAILFLVFTVLYLYFEVDFDEFMRRSFTTYGQIAREDSGFSFVKVLLFVGLIYLSTSILYYFGTVDGKESRFFSSGALLTTILIIVTTYLFGIYIENFSQYNELYGSIGALLIFMLYIWLNSNILLLGFELNASLTSLKNKF